MALWYNIMTVILRSVPCTHLHIVCTYWYIEIATSINSVSDESTQIALSVQSVVKKHHKLHLAHSELNKELDKCAYPRLLTGEREGGKEVIVNTPLQVLYGI